MKFGVDTGRVATTVQNLQDALDNISRERQQMYGAIEALSGMWAGAAHDMFVAQYEGDNTKMVSLIQEIQTVIDNVQLARQSYDTCEETVKSMAAGIQI